MNSLLSSRTQSALPVAFITALVVTALLLLAAIPAIAQAQEPTPTPEQQDQQPAPTQEPTKTVRAELSFSQTAWSADE
ncbi:MAG: hypothetical protein OXF50_11910 [Caldilineaceae bacterium]|nr:hypothetical protein [Caldilineaceae bacterium]